MPVPGNAVGTSYRDTNLPQSVQLFNTYSQHHISDGCIRQQLVRCGGKRQHAATPRGRLATGVCQVRHDRMGQGPTESHAGRSTFLLSSGGAGAGGT